MSKLSGDGFAIPHAGSWVAFADFDNDGFVDVVVANNRDPPLLLRNSGGNGNHFLNFMLVGTKSNRDGLGARIRVTTGPRRRFARSPEEEAIFQSDLRKLWPGQSQDRRNCRNYLTQRTTSAFP